MLEMNKLYLMDCVDGMKQLLENSIELTVTSPPYDNLRKYQGYSFDFESVARELWRITKPGGVVAWVVGDATTNGSESGTSFRQALFFKEIGFNLHDTMIYAKENPVPLTHNRYEQAFEYMFIFSKGKPKTFNPIMIPCNYSGKSKNVMEKRTYDNNAYRHNRSEIITIKEEKQKGNIWYYFIGNKKDEIIDHPAPFPEQLATDHILSWSNENDIVLDPFVGSGTTAKAALLTNRNFIGFEISEKYFKDAQERIDAYLAQGCFWREPDRWD